MVNTATERPIEKSDDDALKRKEFVERLGRSLVLPNGKSSGVVIGLTGSWGSGKSSILNLLRHNLKERYPDSILIVNFDPWLVSGRDDLITQFLAQVIGTINGEPKLKDKLKKFTVTLATYASQLSPIANLIKPGFGALLKGGFAVIKDAFADSKNLQQLRKELETQLSALNIPIVVLIDELDRVEDEEVRAVAQLVRAVADFKSISYLLAYDAERVMEALGGDGERTEKLERGKAYLEKIVQLQIPVPLVMNEEISELLRSSIAPILQELGLDNATSNPRYVALSNTFVSELIVTPRDVKRLVGTFQAVAGMVFGEVDWVDTLAYCSLLVKAPNTIERLRRQFQIVVQDQISEQSVIRRMHLDGSARSERLKLLMQNPDDQGVADVLSSIFPFASEHPNNSFEHQDAACKRRPLLTLLKLGLPPSSVSRTEIENIVRQKSEDLCNSLKSAYASDNFDEFFDRFSEVYFFNSDIDEMEFWIGISKFLVKPNREWLDRYNPMHEIVRSFATLFEKKLSQQEQFRPVANKIMRHFMNVNEKELMPMWLRTHVFAYRLYGNNDGAESPTTLTKDETAVVVPSLARKWREEHLRGELIQSRWDMQPVYTMIDEGSWDGDCRALLSVWMKDDAVMDGVALLLFGAHYSTGRETIEAFCGFDFLVNRAKQRLSSASDDGIDPSVKVALKKILRH